MSPTPAPRSSRWPILVVLLIIAAALTWFGLSILPSIQRSAAASELRSLGFEAGGPGKPGKQGWRSWWDGVWRRWQQGPDPKTVNDWADRVRLMSSPTTSLDAFAPALTKFQPKEILLGFCANLSDVSALRSFPTLRRLDFYSCPQLTDFTIVSHFPQLRQLTFHESPALQSLACIRSTPELESLHVSNCPELSDFDGLQSCKSLRSLWLISCDRLHTADSLRGLSLLEELNLSGCGQLVDVTALHELKKLKTVRLVGSAVPPGAIEALRAALPGATIVVK